MFFTPLKKNDYKTSLSSFVAGTKDVNHSISSMPSSKKSMKLRMEYTSVAVDTGLTEGCQTDWVVSDAATCILLHNEPLSWRQAENQCNQYGGHLISVSDAAIQQVVDAVVTNR